MAAKSTDIVYKVVPGIDGAVNTRDYANENYLGYMEFCGSNRRGHFYFGQQLAELIFIYNVAGWSLEICCNNGLQISVKVVLYPSSAALVNKQSK